MAKIVFGDGLADYAWLEDFFDWQLTLSSSSATSAVFEDSKGSSIILSGVGLEFSGGTLSGGRIKGVELVSEGGEDLITVTGGNYAAKILNADSMWDFLTALSARDDKLIGNDLGTSMNGVGWNHGDDVEIAGTGGSFMGGSEGDDIYRGSGGWDIVSYENAIWQEDAKRGVSVNMERGTATDSWGDKDKFSKIEEFRGSHLSDTFKGSKAEETFMGMKCKDNINGGGGWDEVRYDKDVRYEGGDRGIVANLANGTIADGFGDVDIVKNIEGVHGTKFDDTFIGGDNDDFFGGLGGIDTFDGGNGFDEVNFHWWEGPGPTGINVDMTLASGQVIDDGFGNTETLVSIEGIGGTTQNDTIRLGAEDGNAYGNDGDDTLIAGTGVQQFYGGGGADTFVFESLATVGLKPERDYIDDFNSADGDKVDLSGIAGLIFKGSGGFTGEMGELRVIEVDGFVALSADMNGDKTADFQIIFGNDPTIGAADVLL